MIRIISVILLVSAVSCASKPLPDPLAAGWRGNRVCQQVEDSAVQRVLRCVFPPGVGHEKHFHAPHSGTTLRGGTMKINDSKGTRVVTIKSGRLWHSAGIDWHEVVNVGDTTAVFLIVEPK